MILINNRKLLFEGNPDILGEICSFLSQPWLLDAVNEALLETRKSCARYEATLRIKDSFSGREAKQLVRKLLNRVCSPSQITLKLTGCVNSRETLADLDCCQRLHVYSTDITATAELLRADPSLKDEIRGLGNLTECSSYQKRLRGWSVDQIVDYGPSDEWMQETMRYRESLFQRIPDMRVDCLGDKLEVLKLGCTKLRDIEPLRTMRSLTVLELSGTIVTDISPISALTNLRKLYLRFLPVEDLRHIVNLTRLVVLDMFATKITEISELQGLKTLEDLDISHTQVNDVSVLTCLPRIKTLFAYATAIRTIDCLIECQSLKVLVVTSRGAKLSFTPLINSRRWELFKTSMRSICHRQFRDSMIKCKPLGRILVEASRGDGVVMSVSLWGTEWKRFLIKAS